MAYIAEVKMSNAFGRISKTKIFLDGADVGAIKKFIASDLNVRGFTTNPSLMRAAGVTNYEEFAREAIAAAEGLPISFEVCADEFSEMEREAKIISNWSDNVYVKIPISNSTGDSAAPLIEKLSSAGVRINVTAILTVEQVRVAYSALSPNSPAIISVFAGRIADTGRDPVQMLKTATQIIAPKPLIELLWASTREVYNMVQANEAGCDIITVTEAILSKATLLGKDLEQYSLETVKSLFKDAKSAGYKIEG